MTETPAEQTVEQPSAKYAVYDTAELRFLEGVFPSAKAARDAHKAAMVEGRTYETRQV